VQRFTAPYAAPKPIFNYAFQQRENALEDLARKYASPYFHVVRAKVILMAAEGLRNDQIAAQFPAAANRKQVAQAIL
jgi:gentisate 1,2-dioxygenase